MTKVKELLAEAKNILSLAIASYQNTNWNPSLFTPRFSVSTKFTEQPAIYAEQLLYPSSMSLDGVNKRLQDIHNIIGEIKDENNDAVNLNSLIKSNALQEHNAVRNIIRILLELEKTLLPVQGMPPLKRKLENSTLLAIQKLETAANLISRKPDDYTNRIVRRAKKYAGHGNEEDSSIANELFLIAYHREWRANRQESNPLISVKIIRNLDRETLEFFHKYQNIADKRPQPSAFEEFRAKLNVANSLLGFMEENHGEQRSHDELEEEKAPRKKQKLTHPTANQDARANNDAHQAAAALPPRM